MNGLLEQRSTLEGHVRQLQAQMKIANQRILDLEKALGSMKVGFHKFTLCILKAFGVQRMLELE